MSDIILDGQKLKTERSREMGRERQSERQIEMETELSTEHSTDRTKDFLCFLYRGYSSPLEFLKDAYSCRIMESGGRMSSEKRWKPLSVRKGRRTGTIG